MKFSVAVLSSVAVHVLIGTGIWLYMEYAPTPDVGVSLDLSSVEISFAEIEDESVAASASVPDPEPPPPPPPRTEDPEPPPPPPPPEPEAQESEKVSEPSPEDERSEPPAPEVRPDTERPREEVRRPESAVPAPAPRQAKIDAPPRPKRNIRPDYPKGARQRGEQGAVVVEMLVNADGGVDRAAVVESSGYPELDESAVRAVRAAKFVPAKCGRESVASTARITLTFRLK